MRANTRGRENSQGKRENGTEGAKRRGPGKRRESGWDMWRASAER